MHDEPLNLQLVDTVGTRWLARHPWCWLLIVLALVGIFALWLAGPIHWRDGEGTPKDDGEAIRRIARYGILGWLIRKAMTWKRMN